MAEIIRILSILLLLMQINFTCAQNCYSQDLFPKIFADVNQTEEVWAYSITTSWILQMVFQGGQSKLNGSERAWISAVNLGVNRVQWRRYFVVSGDELLMNAITAMSVHPKGTSLAVVGSHGQNYHIQWFFTVQTVDGGHQTDAVKYILGAQGSAEHQVRDSSLIYAINNMVYVALKQVSPTLRDPTEGILTDYTGRMLVGRFNPSTTTFDWLNEQMNLFGFAGALVYKFQCSRYCANIFVGGANYIEYGGVMQWALTIMRLKDNGSIDEEYPNAFHFVPTNPWDDTLNGPPVIDHMHLEGDEGAEQLFGTTRAQSETSNSQNSLFVWKVKLNLNLDPQPSDLICAQLINANSDISSGTIPDHVIGLKPNLVDGKLHGLLQDRDQAIYYFVYDWSEILNVQAVFIHAIKYSPSFASFMGPSNWHEGTIYEAYISSNHDLIDTHTDTVEFTTVSAILSSTQLPDQTCLPILIYEAEKYQYYNFNLVAMNYVSETQGLQANTLAGSSFSTLALNSWDVTHSNLYDEYSFCSQPPSSIFEVQQGSIDSAACIHWDGTQNLIQFQPHTAFSALDQACKDQLPTWQYMVGENYTGTDALEDFLKISIDPVSSVITVKALSGPVTDHTLTVMINSDLPGTTHTASFELIIDVSVACFDYSLTAPDNIMNQLYYHTNPEGQYEIDDFIRAQDCSQTITYTNTVITANSGFINDFVGLGKLLSWQTDNMDDVGDYVIQIEAQTVCTAQVSAQYTLQVDNFCKIQNYIIDEAGNVFSDPTTSPSITTMVMAAEVSLSWTSADIVVEKDTVDCGPFNFQLSMSDASEIDSAIFTVDDPANPLQLTTFTQNPGAADTYTFTIKVTTPDYPDNPGAQKEFTVLILEDDQCYIAHIAVTPGAIINDQEFYVEEENKVTSFVFEQFTTVPTYCQISYTMTVTPELQGQYSSTIVLDSATRTITVDLEGFSIGLLGDYEVSVTAVTPLKETADTGIGLTWIAHIKSYCVVVLPTVNPNIGSLPVVLEHSYTGESDMIEFNLSPFVIEPPVCEFTMQCQLKNTSPIQIDICNIAKENSHASFDRTLGFYEFWSMDMVSYPAGTYELEISALIRSEVVSITFEIHLIDPCPPNAEIKFDSDTLAKDFIYTLDEAPLIIQHEQAIGFEPDLTSDTLCGKVIYELQFDRTTLNEESGQMSYDASNQSIKIFSQDSDLVGWHTLRLSAYFEHYAEFGTSIVRYIKIQPTSKTIKIITRPDWLDELQDQYMRLGGMDGEKLFEYYLGDRSEESSGLEDSLVSIHVNSLIRQYVFLNETTNTFVVDCEQLSPLQIGVWQVRIEIHYELSDGLIKLGDNISRSDSKLTSTFKLTIGPEEQDGIVIEPDEEKESILSPYKILPESFNGQIVTAQEILNNEQVQRPDPYIVSFTSSGDMKIGWTEEIQFFGGKQDLQSEKVAVDIDLIPDNIDALVQNYEIIQERERRGRRRRQLISREDDSDSADEVKEYQIYLHRNDDQVRLLILSAIEVKLQQTLTSKKEESSEYDIQKSKVLDWRLDDFDENFIEINIDIKDDMMLDDQKYEIIVTFFGASLFQNIKGVEAEFAKTMKQPVLRSISQEKIIDFESYIEVTVIFSLVILILTLLAMGCGGYSLIPSFMFINSLSLLMHTVLFDVNMPAILHYVLTEHLALFRLHISAIDQELELLNREIGPQMHDYRAQEEPLMALCGYHNDFWRNLITPILLIFTLGLALLISIVLDITRRRRGQRRIAPWVSNLSLRFFYEMFFEFILCLLIHHKASEQLPVGSSSDFSFILVLLFMALLATFTIFLFTRLLCNGPTQKDIFDKGTLKYSCCWPSIRRLSSTSKLRLQEGKNEQQEKFSRKIKLKRQQSDKTTTSVQDQQDQQDSDQQSQAAPQIIDKETMKEILKEAQIRVELEEQVKVSRAYETLYDGLRRNHEHNMAVIHPISFVFRRLIYAYAIVHLQQEVNQTAYFSTVILLITCLTMLAIVTLEKQFVQSSINNQHCFNEAVFYLTCISLIMFSGVIINTDQVDMLGNIQMITLLLFIAVNFLVISCNLYNHFRLLAKRYYKMLHQKRLLQKQRNLKLSKVLRDDQSNGEEYELDHSSSVIQHQNSESQFLVSDKAQQKHAVGVNLPIDLEDGADELKEEIDQFKDLQKLPPIEKPLNSKVGSGCQSFHDLSAELAEAEAASVKQSPQSAFPKILQVQPKIGISTLDHEVEQIIVGDAGGSQDVNEHQEGSMHQSQKGEQPSNIDEAQPRDTMPPNSGRRSIVEISPDSQQLDQQEVNAGFGDKLEQSAEQRDSFNKILLIQEKEATDILEKYDKEAMVEDESKQSVHNEPEKQPEKQQQLEANAQDASHYHEVEEEGERIDDEKAACQNDISPERQQSNDLIDETILQDAFPDIRMDRRVQHDLFDPKHEDVDFKSELDEEDMVGQLDLSKELLQIDLKEDDREEDEDNLTILNGEQFSKLSKSVKDAQHSIGSNILGEKENMDLDATRILMRFDLRTNSMNSNNSQMEEENSQQSFNQSNNIVQVPSPYRGDQKSNTRLQQKSSPNSKVLSQNSRPVNNFILNEEDTDDQTVIFYTIPGLEFGDPLKQMFDFKKVPYELKEASEIHSEQECDALNNGYEHQISFLNRIFLSYKGTQYRLCDLNAAISKVLQTDKHLFFDTAENLNDSAVVQPIIDQFAKVLSKQADFTNENNMKNQNTSGVEETNFSRTLTAELDTYQLQCKILHELVEQTLKTHQQKYAAGSSISIADFVLASYIRNHLLNPASAVSSPMQADLENTPLFFQYITGVISKELFPASPMIISQIETLFAKSRDNFHKRVESPKIPPPNDDISKLPKQQNTNSNALNTKRGSKPISRQLTELHSMFDESVGEQQKQQNNKDNPLNTRAADNSLELIDASEEYGVDRNMVNDISNSYMSGLGEQLSLQNQSTGQRFSNNQVSNGNNGKQNQSQFGGGASIGGGTQNRLAEKKTMATLNPIIPKGNRASVKSVARDKEKEKEKKKQLLSKPKEIKKSMKWSQSSWRPSQNKVSSVRNDDAGIYQPQQPNKQFNSGPMILQDFGAESMAGDCNNKAADNMAQTSFINQFMSPKALSNNKSGSLLPSEGITPLPRVASQKNVLQEHAYGYMDITPQKFDIVQGVTTQNSRNASMGRMASERVNESSSYGNRLNQQRGSSRLGRIAEDVLLGGGTSRAASRAGSPRGAGLNSMAAMANKTSMGFAQFAGANSNQRKKSLFQSDHII